MTDREAFEDSILVSQLRSLLDRPDPNAVARLRAQLEALADAVQGGHMSLAAAPQPAAPSWLDGLREIAAEAAETPTESESAPSLRPANNVLESLDRLDRVHAAPPPRRCRWSVHTKLYLAVTAVLVSLLAIAAGVTVAGQKGNSITDLGKPTNDLPARPSSILGSFHRTGPLLRQQGKPELLFLGTMVDGISAVERWALVKALDQFGVFTGITATQERSCFIGGPRNTLTCHPPGDYNGFPGGDPTFNLEHARYTSPHLALVSRDLIDFNLHVPDNLPPVEKNLFNRYVKNTSGLTTPHPTWSAIVWNTALSQPDLPSGPHHVFPLVSIGGYLETSYGAALSGDLTTSLSYVPSFDTIQKSLQEGKPVADPNPKLGKSVPSLVPDVNAEANVITALICHADGQRPASVCGRAVIKRILTHVR